MDLRAAGKIAAFGVSNFDADELQEAVDLAGPGHHLSLGRRLVPTGHKEVGLA